MDSVNAPGRVNKPMRMGASILCTTSRRPIRWFSRVRGKLATRSAGWAYRRCSSDKSVRSECNNPPLLMSQKRERASVSDKSSATRASQSESATPIPAEPEPSAARCQRLFLRAAVDQFPTGRGNRHLGLVHDSCRHPGLARAGDARRTLGTNESERRGELARWKIGRPDVLGRGGANGASNPRNFPRAASNPGKFLHLAVGLCLSFACRGRARGGSFEMRKRDERRAFFASCAYLTGMLTSVVFGVYPLVLCPPGIPCTP